MRITDRIKRCATKAAKAGVLSMSASPEELCTQLATILGDEPDIAAFEARLESDDLSDDERAWVGTLINTTIEWMAEVLGMVAGIGRLVDFGIAAGPTYRTTPIPGAELGGKPRNPEDDVIDEIDRLVDWQIEKGESS